MFKKMINKINKITEGVHEKVKNGAESYMKVYFNPESTKQEKMKAKGVILASTTAFPTYRADYLGGHYDEVNGKEDVKIMLLPEGILTSFYGDAEYIPYTEIKTVDLKTQEEIEKGVTLPRAIAFGWYAIAMQKKKRVVTQYLIVNCEVKGMAYSMVFGGNAVGSLYCDLFKKKMAG